MVRRQSLFACALFLAAVIAPVVAGPPASHVGSMETLRFNAPFALPGVTLGAGEYTFDLNHIDSGNVVSIRAGRSNRVVFSGFTIPAERPRGLQANKSIIFGEGRPGEAAPIRAWYPRSKMVGYEFDYGEDRR